MGEKPPESEAELIASLFTSSHLIAGGHPCSRRCAARTPSALSAAQGFVPGSKIAVAHVREAASQLYATTKAAQLNGVPAARALLDRIVSDVISGRKARAFLMKQDQTPDPLIQQLVDDRILHIIKRGWVR